jgi:hypothetical protein
LKVATGIRLSALLLAVLIIAAASMSFVGNLSAGKLDNTSVIVPPAKLIWEKPYGGIKDDRAFYAADAGEGYLVVGSSKSIMPNTTVGWTLRLDNDGNMVWNKTFLEGSGTELRYAINLTDGFLLVGNEFLPSGDVNGYVAKIDIQGNLLWSTIIGGEKTDKLFSAIATPDGFLLLGLTYSNGNGGSEAWTVKITSLGKIIWNKNYGISNDTAARSGALAPDGDYVITGYTTTQNSSNYNFLLMKLDSSGNMVWNKTYGDQDSQKAYSMTKAADGYIIVGDTESQQSDIDAWVIKVDYNGNVLWTKIVGGKNADSPSYITPSSDDGYLVCGFTFSFGAGNRDFWLFKIDDSGKVLWSCTQGNAGYQEAYSVIQTSQDQYIMVGWTDPSGQPALIGKAQYNFYIVKIEAPQKSDGFSNLEFVACIVVAAGILITALIFASRLNHKQGLSQGKNKLSHQLSTENIKEK